MVAEFINEHNGYLKLTPEEYSANLSLLKRARVFLEHWVHR